MLDISVIVCCKNRPKEVMNCLNSIKRQTLKPSEVILVDSSRTNQLKDFLYKFMRETKVDAKYVYDINANLPKARNLGIQNSRGSIITFVDDDSTLDKNCLLEIAKAFDADSVGKVGAVTGERVLSDDTIGRRLTTSGPLLGLYDLFARLFLLLHYGDGKILASGHPTIIKPGTRAQPTYVQYVIGANMSFRRGALGGFLFDEQITSYDDNDVSMAVASKACIVYLPSARYRHMLALGGQGRGINRIRIDIVSYRRFFLKRFPSDIRHTMICYWSIYGMAIRGFSAILFRPVLRNRLTI